MSGKSGGVIPWIASQADILNNIANNLFPVQRLITGVAYLIGIAFAFKAIHSLKAFGESKAMMSSNASMKEPLIYLFVAAVFIYFPTALRILLATTFGDSGGIWPYAAINSSNSGMNGLFGPNSRVGWALTVIIQTIGGIAFIRGWILISRAAGHGQSPGGTGKGLMHVIGGIIAINIVATIEMVNNTLYG